VSKCLYRSSAVPATHLPGLSCLFPSSAERCNAYSPGSRHADRLVRQWKDRGAILKYWRCEPAPVSLSSHIGPGEVGDADGLLNFSIDHHSVFLEGDKPVPMDRGWAARRTVGRQIKEDWNEAAAGRIGQPGKTPRSASGPVGQIQALNCGSSVWSPLGQRPSLRIARLNSDKSRAATTWPAWVRLNQPLPAHEMEMARGRIEAKPARLLTGSP
jgi:hypothetical protein